MPATEAKPALSADAIYWRAEAQKAIKEREEIKRSLTAADGPAAFWRGQAKEAVKKLGDAQNRVDGLRRGEQEQREYAIRFSSEVDTLKRQAGAVKQQLWEVWAGLEDESATKQQLWEIWAAL